MIFLFFLLDLMRSMTTTSKAAIKIITTMPKAATTPPKTFHWVPTKGCNHMHYIIPYWYYRDKFKMCITTHASGSKKDTIPNLKHAVVVVAGKTHLQPVPLSASVLGHLSWCHNLFLSILLGRYTGTYRILVETDASLIAKYITSFTPSEIPIVVAQYLVIVQLGLIDKVHRSW